MISESKTIFCTSRVPELTGQSFRKPTCEILGLGPLFALSNAGLHFCMRVFRLKKITAGISSTSTIQLLASIWNNTRGKECETSRQGPD